MTINSEWIRKDFKQKYFLYCKDCKTENCLKKIKYLKSNGIIYLEKGNGEIWKLK